MRRRRGIIINERAGSRRLALAMRGVELEVAHRGDEAIEMQMQKQSIQTLLPKGTIKAI